MRVLIPIAAITAQPPPIFDDAKGAQICPLASIKGSKIREEQKQIPRDRDVIPAFGGLYLSTNTFNAAKQAGDTNASKAQPTI